MSGLAGGGIFTRGHLGHPGAAPPVIVCYDINSYDNRAKAVRECGEVVGSRAAEL